MAPAKSKTMKSNHYDLLRLHPSCTETEIKQAFKARALELHPDKNPRPDAGEAFCLVRDAYDCLIEPETRAEYDRQHKFDCAKAGNTELPDEKLSKTRQKKKDEAEERANRPASYENGSDEKPKRNFRMEKREWARAKFEAEFNIPRKATDYSFPQPSCFLKKKVQIKQKAVEKKALELVEKARIDAIKEAKAAGTSKNPTEQYRKHLEKLDRQEREREAQMVIDQRKKEVDRKRLETERKKFQDEKKAYKKAYIEWRNEVLAWRISRKNQLERAKREHKHKKEEPPVVEEISPEAAEKIFAFWAKRDDKKINSSVPKPETGTAQQPPPSPNLEMGLTFENRTTPALSGPSNIPALSAAVEKIQHAAAIAFTKQILEDYDPDQQVEEIEQIEQAYWSIEDLLDAGFIFVDQNKIGGPFGGSYQVLDMEHLRKKCIGRIGHRGHRDGGRSVCNGATSGSEQSRDGGAQDRLLMIMG